MTESRNRSSSEVSHAQSVTQWLDQLKQGDSLAAQKIWDHYLQRLIRIAEKRLRRIRRRIGDEEDVVTVAFTNFLQRLEESGFSRLDDREDLWQVLVMLTDRRAIDQIRQEMAAVHGGRQLVGESAIEAIDEETVGGALEQFPGREPTPEFAYMLTEELEKRLEVLDNDLLRRIALLRMYGYSNHEVAEELDISLRGVERKLGLIRSIWQQELARE